MIDLHWFIPSLPSGDRPPTQHLDAEIACAHLRRHGFEVELTDAALLSGGLHDLREQHRKPARFLFWHLPMVRHLAVFEKWLDEESGDLAHAPTHAPPMIAGGYAATHFASALLERLPRLEAVVRGELERPLEKLLELGDDWREAPGLTRRRADGSIDANPPPPPLEADQLPAAASDLFHESRRQGGQKVLIGRGCESFCRYCGFGPYFAAGSPAAEHWRMRPPERIADEIEALVERFGVERFSFESAVFFGYDERGSRGVEGLCREILRRELAIRFTLVSHPGHLLRNAELVPLLREAGLERIYLGLDSGSDATLRRFDVAFRSEQGLEALHLLHRHRVDFTPLFIFWEPYLERRDVADQLAFLRRAHGDFGHLRPPYAYFLDRHLLHGVLEIKAFMPMTEELRRDGLLVESGAKPWSPLKARFQDPEVSALYRLHRRIRHQLLTPLRPLLWNPRATASAPDLELLPLDLLEAAGALLDAGASEDAAVEAAHAQAREKLAGRVDTLLELAEASPEHRRRVETALR